MDSVLVLVTLLDQSSLPDKGGRMGHHCSVRPALPVQLQ